MTFQVSTSTSSWFLLLDRLKAAGGARVIDMDRRTALDSTSTI